MKRRNRSEFLTAVITIKNCPLQLASRVHSEKKDKFKQVEAMCNKKNPLFYQPG